MFFVPLPKRQSFLYRLLAAFIVGYMRVRGRKQAEAVRCFPSCLKSPSECMKEV